MARQSRLVAEGVVHHVAARGVNRSRIFQNGFDKGRYLKRASVIAEQEKVLIHGYCLMENHVHFLLTPTTRRGLARFFSRLHTWWAMRYNTKYNRSGHLFQGRYFSSPLSEAHYRKALRYVELNPVRARLVSNAADWLWSSVRAHLLLSRRPSIVKIAPIVSRSLPNSPSDWRKFLETATCEVSESVSSFQNPLTRFKTPEFLKGWATNPGHILRNELGSHFREASTRENP